MVGDSLLTQRSRSKICCQTPAYHTLHPGCIVPTVCNPTMSPKTVLAPFYCVARHHGTIKRFLQFSIQPYGRTDCSLTELFTALSSYSRAPKLGEEESFTSAYQESTWSSARCESRGLQAGGYLRHLKKQASLVLLLQADVIVAGRLKRSKWQAVLSWKEILD